MFHLWLLEVNLRKEQIKWTEKFKRREGRKGKGNSTNTNMSTVFYLVSDNGVEVVDVHGLLAQLTGWLQGRR